MTFATLSRAKQTSRLRTLTSEIDSTRILIGKYFSGPRHAEAKAKPSVFAMRGEIGRGDGLIVIKGAPSETTQANSIYHRSRKGADMTKTSGISRRRVLTVVAGAAGTVSGLTAMVGTSTPAQAAKGSQKAVRYHEEGRAAL
jgi:hypothetical protein